MHELSIALSIIDLAIEESERRGGVEIRALHLRMGPLSGVVKEALFAAYALARENTSLESCRMVIEETPLEIYCRGCQVPRQIASVQSLRCPVCNEPSGEILRGRELEVFALEVEE